MCAASSIISFWLTVSVPPVVAGGPGEILLEEAPDGGPEVVEGPGDNDIVVEADPDGNHEHGEADSYNATDRGATKRGRERERGTELGYSGHIGTNGYLERNCDLWRKKME